MTKTLSFAAMHFSIAFAVVYLLTGSLLTGGLVALIEPLCNTIAYHFHEKLWQRNSGAAPLHAFGTARACQH